ncbi:hypothetical protein [Bradyrhizobium sp. C9]|uniref:ABC transporter permease subunit n=1 Tax=Bradyrhizobium sp. C9 TaxID=142585 RepID=UPI000BE9C3A2|nr:hypothetical protein [Bradyrhizobium sp. C9]PDT75023.1 hypothetical protein CO675_22300 [Bradyrhizobium sp. C9]
MAHHDPAQTGCYQRRCVSGRSATEAYFVVLGPVLAAHLFLVWLTRTPFGAVISAIKSDETRTRFFGYDVTRMKH